MISSLLDFLTFALCAPYSETSEGQQFDMLLEMVASNGRTLFKLFQVARRGERKVVWNPTDMLISLFGFQTKRKGK